MPDEAARSAHNEHEGSAFGRRLRPAVIIRRPLTTQEMFATGAALAVAGLLFVTLLLPDAIPVHPIFPLAALVFFLHPFRRLLVPRRILQLSIAAFVCWFCISLSGVLFPFIAAFVIAYIFDPVMRILGRRGLARWASALVVILAILGLYAIVGVFIVPPLVEQGHELVASGAALLKSTQSVLDRERLIRWLVDVGVTPAQARDIVVNTVEPQIKEMFAWILSQIGDFARNATSLLEGVLNLILIPVLSFYFLNDFERIKRFVKGTLLQGNPRYLRLAGKADKILSSYLRGIVTTSSMVGTAAVIVFSILGVPYAGLLGLLTGVFNLIPTVGMFLNLGVAMIVFLFANGNWLGNTLIVAATIGSLHAVNSYMVEPRIIGQRVGLHPMIVIASLFVFGHLLGFFGLVVAVPTAAVMLMFARQWYMENSIPVDIDVPPPTNDL